MSSARGLQGWGTSPPGPLSPPGQAIRPETVAEEGSRPSQPWAQASWTRPFRCPQNGGGSIKGSPGTPRLQGRTARAQLLEKKGEGERKGGET